jgi:hypothetical protein
MPLMSLLFMRVEGIGTEPTGGRWKPQAGCKPNLNAEGHRLIYWHCVEGNRGRTEAQREGLPVGEKRRREDLARPPRLLSQKLHSIESTCIGAVSIFRIPADSLTPPDRHPHRATTGLVAREAGVVKNP